MNLLRLALLVPCLLPAQTVSPGFDHFYSLEYEPAIAIFEKEIAARPNDAAGYNHLAQAILYRAMDRAGALESELVTGNNPFLSRGKIAASPEEQKRFDDAIAKAIALCDGRLRTNANDVEATYLLSVAHGLQANYNFLVRKQWRDSLKQFTLSRKLSMQVTQADPKRVDAYLVQGVHDYIVGSLPFTWKLLGFLIGFRGDKEGGLRTVEMVAAKGDKNKFDAMIALAVAYRRERQPEKAVALLNELIRVFPRNYLFRLELVQMYGDLGQKDEALAVLARMDQLKREGAPGFKTLPAGKMLYARGNLLFWYREYPRAIENLLKVTAATEGLDVNTAMNAWMRLGQAYDLLGKRSQALAAYQQAVDTAPESDAGRESKRYLSSPYRRPASL
jgi:tetratricopeptide (TPR) repeat protein